MQNYDQKIICYLDILGFKEFIKNNENHHIIIKKIFNNINKVVSLLEPEFENSGAKLEYTWISDTLVISGLIKDQPISRARLEQILILERTQQTEGKQSIGQQIAPSTYLFIHIVSTIQLTFILFGLPLRGYIKLVRIDELEKLISKNHPNVSLIYGKGLIECHEQESKEISSPVIVVDDNVFEHANSYGLPNSLDRDTINYPILTKQKYTYHGQNELGVQLYARNFGENAIKKIVDFCVMDEDLMQNFQRGVPAEPHMKIIPEWYEKYKDGNSEIKMKWKYLIDFVKTKDKRWQNFLLGTSHTYP